LPSATADIAEQFKLIDFITVDADYPAPTGFS
jgi:hypothetical protein